MENYVFISHSSKDKETVDSLIQLLSGKGICCWKAPEDIPAGSNYAREIPRAIKECGLFLLVLSSNSQASIWVEKELDAAICHRKQILPIQIDKSPMEDLFQFYLNNVQAVDATRGIESVLDKVTQRINTVLFPKDQSANELIHIISESKKEETVQRNIEPGMRQRSNALRINRIPMACEKCGGHVEMVSLGIYRCDVCGAENYDDLRKVRNYLETVGSAPAMEIAKNTGVSMKAIDHFLKEEYLELPETSSKMPSNSFEGLQGKMHTTLWRK